MSTARLCALTAVALAGCGPAGFSDLGGLQLRLVDLGESFNLVSLDYDFQRVGCKTMGEDFTASVNGGPASIFRGGQLSPIFSSPSCSFPAISFTRPPQVSDGALLIANAGGERLTVQVDGLGFQLAGVPLVTPGEVIHVGQRIQIQLGVGFERVRWPAFGGVWMDGQGGPTTVDLAPPSADGVLEVQLPSTLPPGRQHFAANPTVTPIVTQCEGPAGGCLWDNTVALRAKVDVPFEVQP